MARECGWLLGVNLGVNLNHSSALRHESALCHPSQCTEPSVHLAIMKVVLYCPQDDNLVNNDKQNYTAMLCFPLFKHTQTNVYILKYQHYLIKREQMSLVCQVVTYQLFSRNCTFVRQQEIKSLLVASHSNTHATCLLLKLAV